MAAIGVLRFRFLLCDRAAAGLVRGVAAFVGLGMLLADAARGVLLSRRRVGCDRWKLAALLRFLGCRFSVADALLIVAHDASGLDLSRNRARACPAERLR